MCKCNYTSHTYSLFYTSAFVIAESLSAEFKSAECVSAIKHRALANSASNTYVLVSAEYGIFKWEIWVCKCRMCHCTYTFPTYKFHILHVHICKYAKCKCRFSKCRIRKWAQLHATQPVIQSETVETTTAGKQSHI